MINLIKNILAIICITFFTLLVIIFWQNTSIKLNLLGGFAKKALGISKDYDGFVANEFNDFKDILIRGTLWNINGEKFDRINIELSHQNAVKLNQQRQRLTEGGYLAKGNLILNDNKKIKIKIRAKGDRALHREDFTNMSFKIDVKGSDRVFNLEEFSIQQPILRNYGWELLISNIAIKQGLVAAKIKPVAFSVNGTYRGIYFIEESFTEESLEVANKKVGPIFSLDERQGTVFPWVIYETNGDKNHNSALMSITQHAQKKLLDLRNNFRAPNFEVGFYFDIDLWAKYFSIIDVFGAFHGAIPKSVKLYFNPTTQLFEPLFFDNHIGGKNYTKFSLIDFYTNTEFNYDICGLACTHADWFKVFFSDQELVSRYVFHVKRLINSLDKKEFAFEIEEVENFNNAMYARFVPSDRVFAAGLLPYFMDFDYLSQRSSLINSKIKQISYIEGGLANNFTREMINHNFCLKKLSNFQTCNSSIFPKNIKISVHRDFTLKDSSFLIGDEEVVVFVGNTLISNARISGAKKSMIVQIGGEIVLDGVTFNQIGNVNLPSTNWTGALNIIRAKAELNNVRFQKILGEDALNTVDSKIISKNVLKFDDIQSDAFDSDFSNVIFDRIICEHVGNDCLDTSGSVVQGGFVKGHRIGDKLLSFGEKSNAHLVLANCSKCGIGVAVKDSSEVKIKSIEFYETPLKLSVFKKKPFFREAILNINQLSSSIPRGEILLGEKSEIQLLDQVWVGSRSNISIKNVQYGEKYGISSKK